MSETRGNVGAYIVGTRGVPLARPDRPPAPPRVIPTGLDWDALRGDQPAPAPPVAPPQAATPQPRLVQPPPREDVQRILRWYVDDELSLQAISDKIGRSRTYVAKILRDRNVTLRPPASTPQVQPRDAELERDYLAGASTGDLAKTYQISGTRARQILLARGVTLRTHAESMRLWRDRRTT